MGSLWRAEAGISEGGFGSLLRTVPFGVWAAVLAWLSLSANPRETGLAAAMSFTGGDLWSHALAWGALAVFACLATSMSVGSAWSKLIAWSMCVGYGALMEGFQMIVPGRGSQWVDLVGDVVGATVGVLAVALWSRFKESS